MSKRNAELIRENFARFGRGEVEEVDACWADDAVWHVLDAGPNQADYTRDEYFAHVGEWFERIPDYTYEILSCEAYGPELVVAHMVSSGTTPEGRFDDGDGLMIYRVVDDRIVEGWAMSKGKDTTFHF